MSTSGLKFLPQYTVIDSVIFDIIANYDVFNYFNSKDNFNIHVVDNSGRNNVLFMFLLLCSDFKKNCEVTYLTSCLKQMHQWL